MGMEQMKDVEGVEAAFNETIADMHAHIDTEIEDPEFKDLPSNQFENWFFILVFLGFFLLVVVLIFVVFKCSQKHEQMKAAAKEAEKEERHERFKKPLRCKPWGIQADVEAPTDEVLTKTLDNLPPIPAQQGGNRETTASTAFTSSSETENSEENKSGLGMENYTSSDNKLGVMDSQIDPTICRLCHEKFQHGQPVYESNNPQCPHEFHQPCMDKWLKLQHTCPTCHLPYVVHDK